MKKNVTTKVREMLAKKPNATEEQVLVEILKKENPDALNLPIKDLPKVAKSSGIHIKTIERAVRQVRSEM